MRDPVTSLPLRVRGVESEDEGRCLLRVIRKAAFAEAALSIDLSFSSSFDSRVCAQ